jgi:hypothetical protein
MILLVFFGSATHNLKGLFMNIQQHERITRIKKLSRCLYLVLTGLQYLILVLWPLMVFFAVTGTHGELTFIGGVSLDAADLTYLQRGLIAAFLSVFFFLTIKVTYHFRQLISHFARGDIFNKNAIEHARKALLHALLFYGFSFVSALIEWVYFYIADQAVDKHIPVIINGDLLTGLIFFGLMYILLWALEIGCDLNEESELTI